MARMNSVELTKELFRMAENETKHDFITYASIINAIIVHYLTQKGYYEEDAIKTFQGFLENDTLVW